MNFSINASMGGIHKQLEISQPKTINFSKNTEKRVIDNHLQLLSCGRTFKLLQVKLRYFAAKIDNQNVNSQEDEIAVDYVRLALFVTAFAAVLSGFVFGIAGLAIGAIVCGGGIVFGGKGSHSGSSSGLSPPDKDTTPRFTNTAPYKLKIWGMNALLLLSGATALTSCEKDDPVDPIDQNLIKIEKDIRNDWKIISNSSYYVGFWNTFRDYQARDNIPDETSTFNDSVNLNIKTLQYLDPYLKEEPVEAQQMFKLNNQHCQSWVSRQK
jgi:hypothetical protein